MSLKSVDGVTRFENVEMDGDLSVTGSVCLADGSASAPSLKFTDAATSGLYLKTTGSNEKQPTIMSEGLQSLVAGNTISQINVAHTVYTTDANALLVEDGAGNDAFIVDTSSIDAGVVRVRAGTEALPALRFDCDTTADPDTGIYSPALNELGFSTNGVKRFKIDTTSATLTGADLYLPSTGATASPLNFYAETSGTVTMYKSPSSSIDFYTVSQTSDYRITRIGNVVTLSWDGCTGTSDSSSKTVLKNILPTWAIPDVVTYLTGGSYLNDATYGHLGVFTSGNDVYFSRDSPADNISFSGSVTVTIFAGSVSWVVTS